MPTKGRPQVGTRISVEMYNAMCECISRQNENKEGEPYTKGTWIELAIAEKLAKANRGRGLKGQAAQRLKVRDEQFD
jgi:hypothetical protein